VYTLKYAALNIVVLNAICLTVLATLNISIMMMIIFVSIENCALWIK